MAILLFCYIPVTNRVTGYDLKAYYACLVLSTPICFFGATSRSISKRRDRSTLGRAAGRDITSPKGWVSLQGTRHQVTVRPFRSSAAVRDVLIRCRSDKSSPPPAAARTPSSRLRSALVPLQQEWCLLLLSPCFRCITATLISGLYVLLPSIAITARCPATIS